MFPRRVQPASTAGSRASSHEAEFLRDSEWREVWSFDPALYLPIFHFARMNRIPMLAVNVEPLADAGRGRGGLAAVPATEREGVSDPAPATARTRTCCSRAGGITCRRTRRQDRSVHRRAATREFRRFVESQLVWDRAMAQGIAEAARRAPGAVVVGLMGSGHVMHGWGVSAPAAATGRDPRRCRCCRGTATADCASLVPGLADAVFGVAEPPRAATVGPPAARHHARARGRMACGIGEVTRRHRSPSARACARAT